MIRQDFQKIDPKRRATLDHKKKQFASPVYKQQDYPHRLNFYDIPPTAEITLEQFEQWAIDRLKGMNGDSCNVMRSSAHSSVQYWPKSKLVPIEISRLRRQRHISLLSCRNISHFPPIHPLPPVRQISD
jgi:hypothetical protein